MEKFIVILAILSIIVSLYIIITTHKRNIEIDILNKEAEEELKEKELCLNNLKILISDNTETLNTLNNNINLQKDMANSSFQNYCEILEQSYKEKENEYDTLIKNLNLSYQTEQSKILNNIDKEKEELEKIKSTRISAMDAIRREKEIKEQLSFYCLQVSESDLSDINKLESVKKTLNKPRILSMLIWQTYWQKELKSLIANVVGASEKTGIYKITNIKTQECYIGQAVDISKRWTEHAKCGLGIDTPPANKLYKAMQEYGLDSFSWEILEECPKNLLNEKEKFYIDLYNSCDLGYNSNKGIGK